MRRLLSVLLPRRTAAQMALLVVGSLVLANLVTAGVLILLLRGEEGRAPLFPEAARLGMAARQLLAAPTPEARRIILAAAVAAYPELKTLPADAVPDRSKRTGFDALLLKGLTAQLAGTADVFFVKPQGAEEGAEAIAVRLPDGTGLAYELAWRPPSRGAWTATFLLVITLATLVVVIGFLTIWATLNLVTPLSRLSEAVGRFDPDRDGEIVADRGPIEVRRLARAFNAMSARIRRLVDERTRALAAVSHDLRTPITRMRLRTEEIGDGDLRRQMQADLALMERMVGGALAFLRDGRPSGALVKIDLPPLLQTVCDDFADLGHAASYAGPDHAAARCDPDQIGRALTNLVDNALKFASRVEVRLRLPDGQVVVEVEDNGPGLAADEREKVLEPFYRVDLARSLREGDGFGLGLAIARAIAVAHRGELSLHEGAGGGLLARLSWPADAATR